MSKRRGTAALAAVMLLIVFGLCPSRAAVSTGSATLSWIASPDTNVVGYHIYSGAASGTYTQRVDVGSATSTTVNGLPAGSTNYFVATSYDAQGTESDPSNEAVYIEPGTLSSDLDSSNKLHLVFPVAGGHSYDIQYSTTLTNWTTLTTIFTASNGVYDFIDTNFSGVVKRFYRLVLH